MRSADLNCILYWHNLEILFELYQAMDSIYNLTNLTKQPFIYNLSVVINDIKSALWGDEHNHNDWNRNTCHNQIYIIEIYSILYSITGCTQNSP